MPALKVRLSVRLTRSSRAWLGRRDLVGDLGGSPWCPFTLLRRMAYGQSAYRFTADRFDVNVTATFSVAPGPTNQRPFIN